MPRLATIFVGLVLVSSCTSTPEPAIDLSTPPPSPTETSSPPPAAEPLVSSDDLSCSPGVPKGRQTVAFAVNETIWALDHKSGALTCAFDGLEPGFFAWSPLGDLVVTEGGGIVEVGDDTGPFAFIEDLGAPSTWSRPTGKSFVYLAGDAEQPTKFPVTDDVGSFVLTDLPSGAYEAIAYHPSGTSMAVSVMDDDEPQIFLATNEGARQSRVVIGVSATSFPSLVFDAEGTQLFYLAEHKGSYVQLHRVDLGANELVDMWKSSGDLGDADDLFVSPNGLGFTFTASDGPCTTSIAYRGTGELMTPAIPDAGAPTHALGYLDPRTVLVGVGGCGEPLDLYAVEGTTATWLVSGVDAGASRAAGAAEPAAPLPEDLLGEIEEFG